MDFWHTWNGSIDDVRIYDRVLGSGEMQNPPDAGSATPAYFTTRLSPWGNTKQAMLQVPAAPRSA